MRACIKTATSFYHSHLDAAPSSLYHVIMRIGMLADAYKPRVSGITNYIDLNKRYLEKEGHDVFVFTFGDREDQDDEPRVVRSPGLPLVDTGYYLSFRYSPAAKKLLQSMDVVHVHHPFLSGRLALRYCEPLRIPIVFTNHTRYDLYAQAYLPILPEEISDGLLQAYIPSFCEAMNLVIAPSAGMADVLRKMGVTCHIEVVPNGVELQRFYRAEPLSRADFGFSQDEILLVYAGRIAPEKNLLFLLRAFAGVSQAIKDVHLLIIGGGQKQVEEEMKSLAAGLKVSERIHFTGLIPYSYLPSYLAMCDIFVTASVTETFGMATVEAMAAGLPVVGIHSPGSSDIIEDGKTGFLCTKELAGFAAKLTYLCANKDLFGQMGTAARKASEQYSIERTTEIMLDHYAKLARQTKPKRRKLDQLLISILRKSLR